MTKLVRKQRSRAWFFTYNKIEETSVAQISLLFENLGLEYVFQLEKGEETHSEHYQGVVRYPNPVSNWPELNCHWERCRSWPKAKKYCSKLDTRIAGPWTNISGLRFRKSVVDPLRGKALYAYQRYVLDLIKEDPDDRKVNWIYDEIGCSGKTSLAKHIRLKYGKECILCMGCSRDIFKLVADRLDECIDPRIIIFLLTRQDRGNCSYRAIEALKDGLLVSTKYEPIDLFFNCPHVFIFANFYPIKDKLSNDRWNIIEISREALALDGAREARTSLLV